MKDKTKVVISLVFILLLFAGLAYQLKQNQGPQAVPPGDVVTTSEQECGTVSLTAVAGVTTVSSQDNCFPTETSFSSGQTYDPCYEIVGCVIVNATASGP